MHTPRRVPLVLLLTLAMTLPVAIPALAKIPWDPGVEDAREMAEDRGAELPGENLAFGIPGQVQAGNSAASVGGTPVAFFHYPAPVSFSFANRAGETTIGVNPQTDKTMFLMALNTARVTFDDAASPPSATWEDVSFPTTATVSLDPILYTDRSTSRTFVLQDLAAASSAAYTNDDGATWVPMPYTAAPPGIDHETIGAGPYHAPIPANLPSPAYPNAVYYCGQPGVVSGDNGAPECARSDDGGLTFGPPIPIDRLTNCFPIHGHVVVGPDGSVYVPAQGCGPAASPSRAQGVMYSRDNGLTWNVSLVPGTRETLNPTASGREFGSNPKIDFDATGRLYYVASSATFSGTTQTGKNVVVATSTDQGMTWSAPIDVGAALGVKNTEFPAVVAGDAGRAAVMFYGTPTPGNDQLPGFVGVWHVYVSYTFDAGATWTTIDITPNDPVQVGCIWNRGGSNPCRNLLDFQDMTVDREGRVLVGYADGCIRAACISGANSGSPDPALSRDSFGKIARQASGKGLYAAYDALLTGVALHASANGPYQALEGQPQPLRGVAWGGQAPFSFAWDFDGDGVTDATGPSATFPAHAYGKYPVTLTVTDGAGATARDTAQVLVRKVAGDTLVAHYTFDAAGACDAQGWTTSVGNEVRLVGVSAGGTQWHTSTQDPASAPCSWFEGDESTGMYLDSSASNLVSPGGAGCFFIPPNAQGARLSFQLGGASEPGFDFLHVQARSGCDAGTFADLGGLISGAASALPAYTTVARDPNELLFLVGGGAWQARFRFISDESVDDVGFHIDDVNVYVRDGPPTLVSPGDRSADDLSTMSFTLSASDPDLDPLTFSATGMPAGATLDAKTGAFNWAPTFAQAPGDYVVTFTASDGLFKDSKTVTLHALNLPPTAAGSSSTTHTDRIHAVQFTDASSDADGTIASWAWSFGDGATSAAQNPAHTYATLGSFTPTLTVTDNDGASTSTTLPSITVSNLPPVAKMSAPATANRVDAAQFSDLSVDLDGSIVARLWSFGDGATSTDAEPSHTYSTLGPKTVTLTVTDDDGASSSTQAVVEVLNLLPQAAFSYAPTHPLVLLPTMFTDDTVDRDGTISSWHWTFGDGAQSTEQDPVHVYLAGGLYTVTLTTVDNDGGSASVSQQVFVCSSGVDANTVLNLSHLHVDVTACVDLVADDLPDVRLP